MNRKIAFAVLVPTLTVVLVLTVFYLHQAYRGLLVMAGHGMEAVGRVSIMEEIPLDPEKLLEPEDVDKEPVTFLLYGVDAGEWVGGSYREGPGRADTIILAKTRPAQGTAAMLSIPRDTLVQVPERGDDKVNHAYAYGGADLLVETVEQFSGVPVDAYVGLNYVAFKEIVDLLDGVEFEVDRAIEARGITLEEGVQVLDGDEAFALVSFRKEPMGDIARVERQQRFIKAVMDESLDRSLDELFFIVLAVWKNIDTDLELAEALKLTRGILGMEKEDLEMEIVPGWFYESGGVSYWRAHPEETREIIEDFFSSLRKSFPKQTHIKHRFINRSMKTPIQSR